MTVLTGRLRAQPGGLWLWPALVLAAAALAVLPLRVAAAALLAAGAAVALARAPWLIWAGLAAALPFAAAVSVAGPISVLDVALAAALALWFVEGVRRQRNGGAPLTLARSGPAAAALLYAAVLLLASLNAADLGQAAAEVVKWLECAAVLLVLPVMVAGERVRWVALAALLGAAAQAALGIYQFVFRVGPEWFMVLGRFMRASGTFAQPNPFGGYLGLMLPVAVSLAIGAWGSLWRERRGWPWALAWSAFVAIIATGLLASWSRGAWLGAGVGLAVVVLARSRHAALLGGATAVALALLLAGSLSPAWVPEPVTARLRDIPAFFGGGDILTQEVTDENFAVVERVAHWTAAERMFEASPWLGVGPGNFAAAYPAVRLPRWEEALGHAHNIYLNVLAESGLVGMAAFGTLWLAALVHVWRGRRQALNTGGRFAAALAVGVLGMLAHLAVHNMVDNLFVQGMYVQVALWIGLVTCSRLDDRAAATARMT